jgi:hypothetical protein
MKINNGMVFENVIALIFKVFFTQKYIKIIFFIFLKLFFTSAYQNDLKTSKKIFI